MADFRFAFEDDGILPGNDYSDVPFPGEDALLDDGSTRTAYSADDESQYLPDIGVEEEEIDQGRTIFDSDDVLDFQCNLARFMDVGDLASLAQDVCTWEQSDRASRKEWEEREQRGMIKLGITEETIQGLKSVDPAADWASTAVHPGLMKATIQFWSRTFTELMPSSGPAKAIVLGASNDHQGTLSARAVERCRKEGCRVICLEVTDVSKPYHEIDYHRPLCLVVGNEALGISREVLEMADEIVEIPMWGFKNSVNVAVAFGIVVFEAVRQFQQQET